MKFLVRQLALELGFDDCRFATAAPPKTAEQFVKWLDQGNHGTMNYLARNAAKRINPQLVLPGAQSAIVLATSYHCDVAAPASTPGTGLVARYARFRDYHVVLGERLRQLTKFINELGGRDTRSLWYVDTGPVLERDLAQRAGIGFVGKHTNVISRRLGNWTFLAEILTTLDLEPDVPEKNRCGRCTQCLTACPTAAITAPFQLDARRCISYLTIELKGSIPIELRPLIGNRIYGCDDCLAVCPWNRFARQGSMLRQHQLPGLGSADLLSLLKLDDAGFNARFRDTPLLRTKRRGLLRNVCVALGNVGGRDALPALQQAGEDSEPLIREHACWARERIESRTRGKC